jgi:6,7-dimethyl-8-ribityllumazine synthase
MKDAALRKLIQSGIKESMIEIWDVPGTFELVYAANKMAIEGFDAIICLGCVIQGETRHFDFICKSVAMGIQELVIKHNKPIAFGILTTDNLKQAEERAGGLKGNKGEEAASTILQLLLK